MLSVEKLRDLRDQEFSVSRFVHNVFFHYFVSDLDMELKELGERLPRFRFLTSHYPLFPFVIIIVIKY